MTGLIADTLLQTKYTAIIRADHLSPIMSTALVGLKDNTSKLLHTLWINHRTVPTPVHTKVSMVPADPKGLHHNNLLMANHRMVKFTNTHLDLEGAMATKVMFWGFDYAFCFVDREKGMKMVTRLIIKCGHILIPALLFLVLFPSKALLNIIIPKMKLVFCYFIPPSLIA